jgi:hypothetical protein
MRSGLRRANADSIQKAERRFLGEDYLSYETVRTRDNRQININHSNVFSFGLEFVGLIGFHDISALTP